MNDGVVLSGNLGFLVLGDILQLLGSSGSTGVLRLDTRYASDAGLIYFMDGNPINAQCGEARGLDALYSLFGWVDGTFEFSREAVFVEQRITKSRMGIILEGVRRLDDGHTPKIGPDTAGGKARTTRHPHSSEKRVVKGSLVDYMYIVDEEDFFDGERIVEEGKHGSWLWVILEGVVDIVKEGPSRTIPILRIGDGAFIGNLTSFLLQGHVRTATAIAVGNVQLGVLDSQRLAQEYAGMSVAFKALLASLESRFQQMTERIVAAHGHPVATVDRSEKVLFPKGSERTAKKAMYMVNRGSVSVVRETAGGAIALCRLVEGDYFGHLPFLDLGQESDDAVIYGSADVDIATVDHVPLQQEYHRLSTTFKNIIGNLLDCMSVAADRLAQPTSARSPR